MTTTTAPQVVTPSAVLQFTKQMQLLEQQMVQQLSQVNKALLQVGTAFAKQVAEMSRAQMFLVEQYQKSARAKQKRAHQHLVAICQAVANKARRLLSLRDVAAQFSIDTQQDMRAVLRELLSEQHLANAPNGAHSFVRHTHLEVAVTT
jgi:hypothetical protein